MTDGLRPLREEIAERGFTYVTVNGTSMLPTLRPGDAVRVEACPDPRPGHVVAFERSDKVLVHRVVRRGAGVVTCRGDNRVGDDGPCPLASVVGRAVEVVRAGRAGGTIVRDDRAALLWADARIGWRRACVQAKHAGAEVRLLAGQALGRPPSQVPAACALAGFDVSAGGVQASSAAIIPARLYGSLPRPARIALLHARLRTSPSGSALEVHGVVSQPAQRLARAGAAVRRFLRRVGVAAGEEGDTTWPTVEGIRHVPMHVFTEAQIRAEVREAGGRAETFQVGAEGVVKVWRVTVVPLAKP